MRFDVLQRLDRKNHFAILEAWSDPKAREAHESGPAMTEFRNKVKSLRSGPYDERPMLPDTPLPNCAVYWMLLTPVTSSLPPIRNDELLPG